HEQRLERAHAGVHFGELRAALRMAIVGVVVTIFVALGGIVAHRGSSSIPGRLRPDGLLHASAAFHRRGWRRRRTPLSLAAPTPAPIERPSGIPRRPDDPATVPLRELQARPAESASSR